MYGIIGVVQVELRKEKEKKRERKRLGFWGISKRIFIRLSGVIMYISND